jgi:hypothetical protein
LIGGRACSVGGNSLYVIFKILQFAYDLSKLPLPLFFLDGTFADCEDPFFVDEIGSSRSA